MALGDQNKVLVQYLIEHCGIEAGRITTITRRAADQLSTTHPPTVEILDEDPTQERIEMSEFSVNAEPEEEEETEVQPIFCPSCGHEYVPPAQDYSSMKKPRSTRPKARTKPPENKAMDMSLISTKSTPESPKESSKKKRGAMTDAKSNDSK